MKNHMLWMLVVCLGIYLLLFLLPLFGFNGTNSIFIFMIIFFVAHLFMIGGHGGHSGHDNEEDRIENQTKTQEEHRHGTHQH